MIGKQPKKQAKCAYCKLKFAENQEDLLKRTAEGKQICIFCDSKQPGGKDNEKNN